MNISLRQLRVFLAVAEAGSFSRAGQSLHLSQPAVSRWISELETELGVRLLDRSTREVHLSDAGHQLANALTPLLEDLDTTLHATRQAAEQHSGTVRVASAPTLSASLMPACIAVCAQQPPNIRLVMRDQFQNQVLDSVRSGAVDFGLAVEPAPDEELHTEELLQDPFLLVCRQHHPLAALKEVPWTALQGEALVLLDHASGSRRLIDQQLQSRGITADITQEVGHLGTAYRLIELGIGSSIIPGLGQPLADSLQPRQLAIRPLVPTVSRAIVLVRRRRRSLSPAAERVWSLIAQQTRVTGLSLQP